MGNLTSYQDFFKKNVNSSKVFLITFEEDTLGFLKIPSNVLFDLFLAKKSGWKDGVYHFSFMKRQKNKIFHSTEFWREIQKLVPSGDTIHGLIDYVENWNNIFSSIILNNFFDLPVKFKKNLDQEI